MKWPFHTAHRTVIAQLGFRLLLGVGLLLVVIIGSFATGVIITTNQRYLGQQTVAIHDDVNGMLQGMIDQETGLRGYIATDDVAFLQPFEQGRPNYLSSLQQLHAYTQDSHFSTTRVALAHTEAQANTWYTTFALVQIHEIQTGNFTESRSFARVTQGKTLFDRFRAQVAALQVEADRNITVFQTQIDTNNRLVLGGAGALALVALLYIWWTFSRFARDLDAQLALIKQAAVQLGAGDLTARVDELHYEELQQIGQTFNTLADAVQQRDERLQAALQDAKIHFARLESTRSQLRAIIDASQEAMLFLTPGGRPINVNKRFTDFFGLDDTTVLSQAPDELRAMLKALFVDAVSLDRSLNWSAPDNDLIFSEQQVQMEPAQREFDFSSLPVKNVYQNYIGRLYVWHDATHERAVDRMKSEFVSLVSHELRTPLTSIKGYIDLLMTDESVGELNELQREFLGITQKNARRLVSLINDLLDLSHIESGKIELRREPLNVNLLINELMPSFQPSWDAKRQTFTLRLPEEELSVLGDADRVTQILANLLSNAHKYTPDEGYIDLTVETESSFARIAVTDSGFGLSSEEQAQLFTRFYRAHNAATEMVGGTGLGLVITQSLVEMQGGEIHVSSTPGHGSTFSFTLPLAQPQALSTMPRENFLGKRILVVDDEPDIRRLVRRYLEAAGYEVLLAATGAEACLLAKTTRPDLITLDMLLPDIDGLTILECLKSDSATASIPVIILTIVEDDGHGRLLGATDYLDKPIEAKDLLQRITTTLADQSHSLILLVAQVGENHELLVSALRQAGHEVMIVANGEEAVALAKSASPGLLIMDATVPPMGGMALLLALRSDPATRTLPVIITGTQPGEFGMHWNTLTPIGHVDIWGNPSHVEAIVKVITQRLHTGASISGVR